MTGKCQVDNNFWAFVQNFSTTLPAPPLTHTLTPRPHHILDPPRHDTLSSSPTTLIYDETPSCPRILTTFSQNSPLLIPIIEHPPFDTSRRFLTELLIGKEKGGACYGWCEGFWGKGVCIRGPWKLGVSGISTTNLPRFVLIHVGCLFCIPRSGVVLSTSSAPLLPVPPPTPEKTRPHPKPMPLTQQRSRPRFRRQRRRCFRPRILCFRRCRPRRPSCTSTRFHWSTS